MSRKLTAGLIVVGMTIATISLFPAPAAHATSFHSEAETTTLKGNEPAATFYFNAGQLNCAATYAGTQAAKTTSELTVAPSYSGCMLSTVGSTEVSMNGCSFVYVLYAVTTYGELDIECPEGKQIQMVAKAFGVTKCTIKVGAQTGIESVLFSSTGSGSNRRLHASYIVLEALSYTQTAGSGLGACKGGAFTNGGYEGSVEFQGLSAGNEWVGLWVG